MEVDGKIVEEKRPASKWFAWGSYWYVLFVQTHEEQKVAEQLQRRLDPERYKVFVPTKAYAFKSKGVTEIRQVPWLTGYVFMASTEKPAECIKMVEPLIFNDSTIFRLVSSDGTYETIALSPEDMAIMAAILDEDFNVRAIPAETVDGKTRIKSNPLEKIGGEILRVNNHKQTALVRMALHGRIFDCEIALEFAVDLDKVKK